MLRSSIGGRCQLPAIAALPIPSNLPHSFTSSRFHSTTINQTTAAISTSNIHFIHSNNVNPASASSLRSFHSSVFRSLPPPASTLIDPSGPTSATFDAPLPTLAPVARIDPNELQISDNCQRRLLTLSRKHNKPVHLRVFVDQGGCSGLEYKFSTHVDGKETEEDIVISLGSTGNSVFVDRDSWLWLRGARIDYVEELARAAFVVSENPNATQACGCKSSFAPKLDSQGVPVAQANAQ